ncbi:SulP family inorganic anion transporter [Paraburkholderia tagetis]|uniref:SulP family inorganic anion transporter n=1 Tax=Paraburkholderia tagetis TaxID=2913261 RepID=A0A9X1UDW9_9BURK|nr:SulP family inorganic anion transporter [Paraburkholderia tagetis]MCG5072565.1 SulP family inorganic anion transporter [Paraburkholderia tagetis]
METARSGPSRLSSLRSELLAGLTSSFALVPECIAFALVAHLNPLMGLYGAFFICTITALFGGRPGMISGAAGSMAVVIVALVVQHGPQYLFATVILGGVLMLLFGALKLGKLIRMVPHPVMLGFVNGLAIIIARAQLEHFKAPGAHGMEWMHGAALWLMGGLVALTMAIVFVVPRLTRSVPPALVAIVGVGAAAALLHLPARTLGDMAHIAGGLPVFSMPSVPMNMDTLRIVLPYAVLMSLVGLLETLLTLNLTDDVTGTRGQPNRECVALGAANVAAGMFGAMGGCAMIGQTVINLGSGGRSRVSGVTSGVMILLFILCLSPLIERIPLAALVGVMFIVAGQTFAWGSLRVLHKVPRNDAVVIVAVTVITVCTDLATAVLCGIVIASLNFAWQHAREFRCETRDEASGERVYVPRGTLFFASAAHFQMLFDPARDPAQVRLDCAHLQVADHSAIAALEAVQARYERTGKHLVLANLSPRCKGLLARAQVEVRLGEVRV